MNRQEILSSIKELVGSNSDMSLFDRYSTSELKKILDDMKKVQVVADPSIQQTVILAGCFLILAVVILVKKGK